METTTQLTEREKLERVAREMVTAVEPQTAAALNAILDLIEADRQDA